MTWLGSASGRALPRGSSPRHAPAFEPLMVVEAQHEQQVPDPSLGDFGEELDFGVDDDTLMRLLEDPMDEVDCFRASPMAASPAPMTRAPAPAPAPAISIAPAVPTVTKPPLVPIAPLLPMPCVAPGVGPLLLPKAEPGTMLQVPAHLAIPPHLLAAMPAALAAQAAAASGQPQMVRMVKDIAPMPMIVDPTAGAGLVGVKRKEDSLSPAPTTLYSYTEGGSMAEVETKESKKQKRLIRNRMSAQLHRERQKAHVDQLQAQLKEKDAEIARLKEQVEELSRENESYRQEVEALRTSSHRRHHSSSGNLSDGYTTSSSGGTTPEHNPLEAGYLSDGSTGAGVAGSPPRPMGGVALLSALMLFTFLAAPSTLLLSSKQQHGSARALLPSWLGGSSANSAHTPSSPSVSVVPALTWSASASQALHQITAGAKSSSSATTLVPPPPPVTQSDATDSIRHLASTAVAPYASRALLAVQQDGTTRRQQQKHEAPPIVTPGDADLSGGRPYVLDPLESMPAKWRDTTPGKGAPWEYKQALDLFQFQQHNGSTVFNLTSPPLFEHASNNPSRLRGQHQHTGATTTVTRPTTTSRQVDVYRNDKGNKQVDIYRQYATDSDASSSSSSPHRVPPGSSTSYMFCPEAYGMMSLDVSRSTWSRVQKQDERQEVDATTGKGIRVAPFGSGAPAIVLSGPSPATTATDSTTSTAGNKNDSAAAAGQDGDGSSPPYLLLLVPSDTMDWGGTSDKRPYWEQQDQRTWLEVGCRLTSVRVVNDVRFSV